MEKFIQMYCGCGKGKTAAALGWSIMRASEGKSVFLVSFLKGKSTYSKEYLQRLEPEIQIFTFDRYDAGLLLDAINRSKTLFFTNRWCWDEMVQRDMAKDVSWEHSAKLYRNLYLELTQ